MGTLWAPWLRRPPARMDPFLTGPNSDGHLSCNIYLSIDDPREQEQATCQMSLRYQEKKAAE